MDNVQKCIRCGSTQLSSGYLQSTGRMSFRPKSVHFFAPKTATLSVRGRMCLECGSIDLVGDLDKAQALVKTG